MKIPAYILSTTYIHQNTSGTTSFTIQKGEFICPVRNEYLPKHMLDDPKYKHMWTDDWTMCYTKYGFIPIPTKYITERDR